MNEIAWNSKTILSFVYIYLKFHFIRELSIFWNFVFKMLNSQKHCFSTLFWLEFPNAIQINANGPNNTHCTFCCYKFQIRIFQTEICTTINRQMVVSVSVCLLDCAITNTYTHYLHIALLVLLIYSKCTMKASKRERENKSRMKIRLDACSLKYLLICEYNALFLLQFYPFVCISEWVNVWVCFKWV